MSNNHGRILIYSDSSDFGGHEYMLLRHLKNSIKNSRLKNGMISLIMNNCNVRFISKLKELDIDKYVDVYYIDKYKSNKNISMFLSLMFVCIRILKRDRPEKVLLLQGNTDSCLIGLVSALICRRTVLSYLPLPHSYAATGGRYACLRDLFVKVVFFNLISRYVTISENLKNVLVDRGVSSTNVFVCENTISSNLNVNSSKTKPFFKNNGTLKILMLGRVYFKQKGHDILLREVAILLSKGFIQFQVLIVGDGPDLFQLEEMLRSKSLSNYIGLIGWVDDVSSIISDCDLLVIPSRYEGVPLVMLEALSLRRPVVASRRDGMVDYLPSQFLFDPDKHGDLASLVSEILKNKRVLNGQNEAYSNFIASELRGRCFLEFLS